MLQIELCNLYATGLGCDPSTAMEGTNCYQPSISIATSQEDVFPFFDYRSSFPQRLY